MTPSLRRLEPPFDLVHVLARLKHPDDLRVSARPADAVLLERLDERRLGVARRRLGELLLRLQLAQREPIPFGQRRKQAGRRILVRIGLRRRCDGSRSLSASSLPARRRSSSRGTSAPIPSRGRDSPAGLDLDGRFVEDRRRHLRRDEPVPDQPVRASTDPPSGTRGPSPGSYCIDVGRIASCASCASAFALK